jgi:CBS domain-containing protein
MRRLSDIIFNQNPLILSEEASVKEACTLMRDRRTGSVIATDKNGKLAGIFTGRDAVSRVLAAGKSATETKLAEVMTANPDTLLPDQTAIDALRLMWDGGYRHLPVVKDGKILGIVSRGDFKADEQDRIEEERNLWEHMR